MSQNKSHSEETVRSTEESGAKGHCVINRYGTMHEESIKPTRSIHKPKSIKRSNYINNNPKKPTS
ncbi:MAG: hypothetical protein ISR65_08205 [Bacteriovoracaceae bacterium]|nr:hypothetical protein [Bacteriovoracaceae bacterium]